MNPCMRILWSLSSIISTSFFLKPYPDDWWEKPRYFCLRVLACTQWQECCHLGIGHTMSEDLSTRKFDALGNSKSSICHTTLYRYVNIRLLHIPNFPCSESVSIRFIYSILSWSASCQLHFCVGNSLSSKVCGNVLAILCLVWPRSSPVTGYMLCYNGNDTSLFF